MIMEQHAYTFRQLAPDECDLGYACLLETCAWLERKQIRQWLKPLPRETYARRHARGENFGLFKDQHLKAVVSLMPAIPEYWQDLVPDSAATWLASLAARVPGAGFGSRTMRSAIELLRKERRLPVYLDCRTGFLERFYLEEGFAPLAVRTFSPAPDFTFDAVLMRYDAPY